MALPNWMLADVLRLQVDSRQIGSLHKADSDVGVPREHIHSLAGFAHRMQALARQFLGQIYGSQQASDHLQHPDMGNSQQPQAAG